MLFHLKCECKITLVIKATEQNNKSNYCKAWFMLEQCIAVMTLPDLVLTTCPTINSYYYKSKNKNKSQAKDESLG